MLYDDLRDAIRTLIRTPVFAVTVIGTSALAIASTTAVFSVVNAVLLRPLPFRDPRQLIQIAEKNDRMHVDNFGASVLNFVAWRERTRAFDELAGLGYATFTLAGAGDPEQLTGNRVSPALLRVLGLSVVAGRGFSDDEERPEAAPVAMIGEGYWARRFARDPGIIGRTLTLNGTPVTIVGVAPSALALFSGSDVYVPLKIDAAREIRLSHTLLVAGRLKPGLTLRQAEADADRMAADLARTYPEMRDWGVHLITFFHTFVNAQLETALLTLLAAVVCVLLVACANIANLLLAREVARRREFAVRTALGASRGRLLGHRLVESLTLSAIGGAAGTVAAVVAVKMMNRSLPANLLPVRDIPIDTTVLLFAVAITIGTGIAFGIAPALTARDQGVHELLKGARIAGGRTRRVRAVLAGAELGLATMLLVGAGLLVQTFINLQHVGLGFEPHGRLTFQLAPPTAKYPLADRAAAFYRTLIETLGGIPGVRDVAVSSGIPFGQGTYTTTPMIAAPPSALPPDTQVPIDWRIVSPGYFRTMGIPIVGGRDFSDADGPPAPNVVIVSQSTARTLWGAADPIGRTLVRPADHRSMTVVGIVGDVRSTTLTKESPSLYYPVAARVWPRMEIVVRSDAPPATVLPVIRQRIRQIDPELAPALVRTLDEWVWNSSAQPRLSATLAGVFAMVAVAIAAVGIYGVLAYSVAQRTREIGVRIALGAPAARVVRLIVGEGMTVALSGIGGGLVLSWLLSHVMSTLLYGLAPRDPMTLLGVAAALGLVALAACWLPAVRAARVDPIVTLRDE